MRVIVAKNSSSSARTPVYVIARDIQRNDAVGNFAVQIAKLLDTAGFDARLAAENCHPDDRNHILKMPDVLDTIEPDAIILFQFSTFDPAFPVVAALANRKIVFFQNITPEQFFAGHDDHTAALVREGLAQRPLCAQFDVIMANSKATARALCEGLSPQDIRRIDPSRIIACPPVIGADRWNEVQCETPKSYGAERLILFVGRLVPHKGVDDLIDGFAVLAARHADVRLALVGGPPSSTYSLSLKQKVSELTATIGHRVEFHHDITDAALKGLFERASVFVSMSHHEGFGVPLLDAIFFDKPIVIRDEPGMVETAGEAALVLAAPSPTAIAETMWVAMSDSAVHARLADARVARSAMLAQQSNGSLLLQAINRIAASEGNREDH